jgi:hypothetical protein
MKEKVMDVTFWDFLNSGIFSLLFGATGAGLISFLWHKKTHRFEQKFKFIEKITGLFHKFSGLLYRGDLKDEVFEDIHGEFGAAIDVVRTVFSEEVAKDWERVNGHLLQAKKLLMDGKEKEAKEEMSEAFTIKFHLMDKMGKELD